MKKEYKILNDMGYTNDKIDTLLSLGYTIKDILKINRKTNIIATYSNKSIIDKFNYLLSLGFSKIETISITTICPQIYCYKQDSIKTKFDNLISLGYTYKEAKTIIINYPAILNMSLEYIKEKIEFYNSIGLHNVLIKDANHLITSLSLVYARYMFLKEKDITIDEKNYRKLFMRSKQFQKKYNISSEELINKYPYKTNKKRVPNSRITKPVEETMSTKYYGMINYLVQLGYKKEEAIKILKKNPTLADLSPNSINDKINNFLEIGFTKEELHALMLKYPVVLCMSIENINAKIDAFRTLGYSKIDIVKISKRLPTIFCYSIDNIKTKIEDMISLGFTREEVIKMIKLFPSVLSISIDNIKNKINIFLEHGYTYDEILYTFKVIPSIIASAPDNLKRKLNFYNTIGISDCIKAKPIKLMLSLNLVYARYRFLSERGIIIDEKSSVKLFCNNKQFERVNGISKEALLNMYSYDNEVKKNERNI